MGDGNDHSGSGPMFEFPIDLRTRRCEREEATGGDLQVAPASNARSIT